VELQKVYQPHKVEGKCYKFWLENKLFHSEINPEKEPFVILIPPPNVTGSLHMGHALDNTLQDILIRFKKMQGYNTLWVPGTDHAGIATQNVVEKQLRKKGITRQDLGREKFLNYVWEWKEKYGRDIIYQLQRLGVSCDWDRERFTLDEVCSRAVREAFYRLFQKGLIYRGEYMINWCPRCSTAISDLEVEYVEKEGHLYYILYPFKDREGGIIVATTRPETMLGDTAVAVNPSDTRYRELIGKMLILPLVKREIPIIADEYADPAFGSGAVKITPAHDFNDYIVSKRHNLQPVIVIGKDGKMTEASGKFAGLTREDCHKVVVEELTQEGLLKEVKPYLHSVGSCARCGTIIEPYISEQWFCRMKPLAEPAIKVVEEGKIKFYPSRFKEFYLQWMREIKDWCISRQLWWGHQIPIWYCKNCQNTFCEIKITPTRCPECESTQIYQDPDVLDTWFSSALWPISVFGWPEDTTELNYFYPTSVLVTGRDIIYLWVARMIMMGMEFKGEVPFYNVLIHATILNKEGKRMSKSLGTGVDPLEIMDTYGTDALRFALAYMTGQGQDIRFTEEKVEMSRNFANKIWNASRFVLMNLTNLNPAIELKKEELTLSEKWILSRLQKLIDVVTASLESYDFYEAVAAIYKFFWSEYCDWYIEIAKFNLADNSNSRREITKFLLWYVLKESLKLLHPFMPFITEELWSYLPATSSSSIMLATFPTSKKEWIDNEAEQKMSYIQEIIKGMRSLRGELNLPPGIEREFVIVTTSKEQELLKENKKIITNLTKAKSLEILSPAGFSPPKSLISPVEDVEIYLLASEEEITAARLRIKKELQRLTQELSKVEERLSNANFKGKAPPNIILQEERKKEELLEKKNILLERSKTLGGIDNG